jgi:hypothetical protein
VSAETWLSGLSLFISLVAMPAAIFFNKEWFAAWISKGMQHHFDTKIEGLFDVLFICYFFSEDVAILFMLKVFISRSFVIRIHHY